jgi:hypothetical protein
MVSQSGQLAVLWSRKAVREGEAGAVGIDTPAPKGSLPHCAGLLHQRNALFEQFRETPTPMRCEQWRKPSRASTNNDHTCAIETQSHLL